MKRTMFPFAAVAALVVLVPAAFVAGSVMSAQTPATPAAAPAAMSEHDHMAMDQGQRQQGPPYTAPKNDKIPPADPDVKDILASSPRHGEWVDIKMPDGPPIKSFVAYPVKSGKTGVVIVIHENRGLTEWTEGVADQLAKEGFIAISPDLLSGKGPNGGATDSIPAASVTQMIGTLTPADREARLNAVMAYGKSIPSSNGKTGVVGFCWGGGSTLLYAMAQPQLNAAVMYYGPAPTQQGSGAYDLSGLPKVHAPILAHYPSTDPRTLNSAEPIQTEMKKLGKSFEFFVYQDATHGFMHQRIEPDYKAAVESWPRTVAFFATNLK